jgi:hypothetical protein
MCPHFPLLSAALVRLTRLAAAPLSVFALL